MEGTTEIVHKVDFVEFDRNCSAFEITNGYRWEIIVFLGGDLFMKPIRFSNEGGMREFLVSLKDTLSLMQDKDFDIHVGHWDLSKEPVIKTKGRDLGQ